MKYSSSFVVISSLLFSCFCFSKADNNLCSQYYAYAAITDPSVSSSTGDSHVLYLFGTNLTNGIQTFGFDLNGGDLSINSSDGTASLTGRLVPLGGASTQDGFYLSISFASPMTNEVYMGKDELNADVAVNTSAWSYFVVTSPSTMTGFGAFSGLIYNLTQQMMMMPLQIGISASGKNTLLGASVWLNINYGSTTVAADININLNCTTSQGRCPGGTKTLQASAADVDSYAQYTGGDAFTFFNAPAEYIPAMSWVFLSGSGLISADSQGDFILTGTIVPLVSSSSSASFDVDIRFRAPSTTELSAIDMMPLHKELSSDAYVEQGGPIDTSKWRYFLIENGNSTINSSSGNVTIMVYAQMGMPAQVGFGANGRNVGFGASSWFDYEILDNGNSVFNGSMDINIDLNCPNMTTPPPPACNVITTTSLRTFWLNDGQNISLFDVTLRNNGTSAVTNATVDISYPSLLGCSPNSACTQQLWNLESLGNGQFQLPSWLTDFGGLAVGSDLVFGIIAASSTVSIMVNPTC